MTAPSAPRRAGGDRPPRRPATTGLLAARAALLLVLALLLAMSFGGSALAGEPAPSPVVIGPAPAIAPPPPSLPKAKKAGHKARGGKPSRKNGKVHKQAGGHDPLQLEASCAPLSHTQTYSSWGPAAAYGMPVTVVYEASRCSTPDGSSLDLSADGTARIFAGTSASGTLLASRPFLVTGTWRQPQNAEAWPPAWWECSVPFANYTWQIPGVYTFRVAARDGVWNLDISSEGLEPQAFSWTHDGCA